MKIGLTGAHGTGKTSLAKNLQSNLIKINITKICNETPRIIIDLVDDSTFFQRGKNTTLRQLLIFLFQATEDYFQEKEADILIADRTMIDHLAYTLDLFPEFENSAECNALIFSIKKWMQTYDHIFKIPIEFPLENDGVREEDINFQARIDQKIDALYDKFNIQPIPVSGSTQDRADFILKKIFSVD
ncbi:MAG: ATP-binding protein [Nisaea sp.]|uniref:ATP/GTP-binding protein n=1 Tax=Nisaea sp. TaxID=2024842 RepID=UPI001B1B95C8|nr:ATP-binding protein [Nisaea sp.]MBO6561848.1 ATP-binding protein [Nisaea sp.]